MKPRSEAGTIVGLSRGSVIRRNFCHRVSPSTSAASYRSSGMPWSPPEKTIIMNGIPSHTFAAITATRAQGIDPSQSMDPPNRASMTPPRSNIPRHAMMLMYEGTAHGRRKRVR